MTALCETSPKRDSNIVADFLRYFDVELAATPEQKAAVYGLRYKVYCLEEQYESAPRYPNRQETDEYDDRSLHCLITHRSSGIHAGCVRVVSGEKGGLLPFEKHCPDSVEPGFFQAHNLSRDNICEISRLAVDGRFRRRMGNQSPEQGKDASALQFCERELRTLPLIASANFLAATALTAISDQTSVFALMEPYLPRLMRRAGYRFQRAGHDVEHNGTRAPYFIRTQRAVERLQPELRELYDAIHDDLARGFHRKPGLNSPGEKVDGRPWGPAELLGASALRPVFAGGSC
jgi:N-acyl amino acid synthase of PEP-CTERM/exosortase system